MTILNRIRLMMCLQLLSLHLESIKTKIYYQHYVCLKHRLCIKNLENNLYMRNLLKKPKFKKKNFKSDFEEQFLKKETLQ